MPQQTASSVENNFSGGLKTEFTGLNFPENACTDIDNCVLSLIGDIARRPGFDHELNYALSTIDRTDSAISTYKWTNVGGDGSTAILVVQVGTTLYFFRYSSATDAAPISVNRLVSTVNLASFIPAGGTTPKAVECQYADGNGYLFVFNSNLDPIYCVYNAGTITAYAIDINIRDFAGIYENVAVNNRPTSLTIEHKYNLQNQSWTTFTAPPWNAHSTTPTVTLSGGAAYVTTGNHTFTVSTAGLNITNGSNVSVSGSATITVSLGPATFTFPITMTGLVVSYVGTTLVLNITSVNGPAVIGTATAIVAEAYDIFSSNTVGGTVTAWFNAISNYPSNSDVWWIYKDNTGLFNPAVTYANYTANSGPSPRGFYILKAFNQQRSAVSGIAGLTDVVTTLRPSTGTWFQGRVWYAGVDASAPASGDEPFYTWTENIYFSQVVVNTSEFGMCYQNNDPTNQDFFDLLPTDGGVIQIQGSGTIFKLKTIQNGLLVFAANGIWFITGSQGIGFAANDYTITKISSVQSISFTSFIDVLGFPIFWNDEGIYTVSPSATGGGLTVNNLCLSTILSFYSKIPKMSKRYARGDYNPQTFVVSWVYKDTNETSITDRYQFNRILNLNTSNKAFYPYSIGSPTQIYVHDINYIVSAESTTAPDPTFKYLISGYSSGAYHFTFAEERDDTNWVDFKSSDGTGVNYVSNFLTGYKLHGKALTKWQPQYIYVFSDNTVPTAYKIQGVWDYATSGNSGKYSTVHSAITTKTNFGITYRRHRIRGHGIALQIGITSVDGFPFEIIGWSIYETINSGV